MAEEPAQSLGPEPKKPTTSYIYFNTEFVANLRAKEPDLKQGDLFKMAGAKWASMTDAEKAKYNKLALQDKQRF